MAPRRRCRCGSRPTLRAFLPRVYDAGLTASNGVGHHEWVDLNQGILAVIALAVVAGGGIIAIDALVIRKIRRLAPSSKPRSQDPTIDE